MCEEKEYHLEELTTLEDLKEFLDYKEICNHQYAFCDDEGRLIK